MQKNSFVPITILLVIFFIGIAATVAAIFANFSPLIILGYLTMLVSGLLLFVGIIIIMRKMSK